MVEQNTVNVEVVGSNPALPAKRNAPMVSTAEHETLVKFRCWFESGWELKNMPL